MYSSAPKCEENPALFSPSTPTLSLEKKSKDLTKCPSPKVILLAGPTGSGKTELSLILAEMLKGEIVSADSIQVYRGMDIGTAKVSEKDRLRIPHHLIDIRHIQESFNVVDFYFEAKQSINSILARNRIPIVVGGSGFYFRVLINGPPQGPPSFSDLRDALKKEMDTLGHEAMYQRLKKADPKYAASITANDRQKVIRALEILILTGDKVSKIQWTRQSAYRDYTYHSWFIYHPREILYPNLDIRCEQMIEAGLIEEVEELETQGLRMNVSASQAIGYRQCLTFLESSKSPQEYKNFLQKFKIASRHYAKRQFTWFRKEPIFQWLDINVHDLEIIAEIIADEFNSAI
ncbi:MAG: tRNA (adenosine(37)-N6)-dimethylallyltransferase MiaA [Chlamydiales bacterium]